MGLNRIDFGTAYVLSVGATRTAIVMPDGVWSPGRGEPDRLSGWWRWFDEDETQWRRSTFIARVVDIEAEGRSHPDQERIRVEIVKAQIAHAAGVS